MLALQLLSAVITMSGEVDEAGYRTLGHVLRQVKPHHWGGEAPRRVAEAVMGHLEAGTAVGYVTLRTELPEFTQTIDQISAAEGIENIQLGARALGEHGALNDLSAVLTTAGKRLSTRVAGVSAASLAAQVASELSGLMAGGSNAVSVADIPSLTDHYRRMEQRPGAVVSIYDQLNRHLRWGGLPMSDCDGETILVCARSGHGKTALGIHVALLVARAGYKVDYDVIADAAFEQINERLVHHIAGLSLTRPGELDKVLPERGRRPAELRVQRLDWAQSVLRGLPIRINDNANMDQDELRMRLADKRARGVAFSVLENLDHCSWNQREVRLERREYLGELVKITRQHDRACGHHSMWLVQANRKTGENRDQIPMPENTQDSDLPKNHCTLFLGLNNKNTQQKPGSTGGAPLHGRVQKNRSGATGDFYLPYSIVNPALRPTEEET
ncbi:DnaB-like helicase C-terminal domain-containing protein [Deinococcus radiomollis]|uniref:DnaB-like helicase C-terminal domain-containing protein n=1 Tax=Deinococcus radiomollis TaxID=468916 RepID=UPI003891F538